MLHRIGILILLFTFSGNCFSQGTCQTSSPYTYSNGIYEFEQNPNEISWKYSIHKFTPIWKNANKESNFIPTNYTVAIYFSFLDEQDQELFNFQSSCLYLVDAFDYFNSVVQSHCYEGAVKVVSSIAIYDNPEGVCEEEDLLTILTHTKIIDNPSDENKRYNCINDWDTISYKPLNNDTISFVFGVSRYSPYYIQSYARKYKCRTIGGSNKCDTFYLAATNFCESDSLSLNFSIPFESLLYDCPENFQVFKQYNNQEPLSITSTLNENNVRSKRSNRYACPYNLKDTACVFSYDGSENNFEFSTIADTVNDATFAENHKFTKITYYIVIQSNCGDENFYTISQSIYVYKPLRYIPKELYHNCTNDASGMIVLNMEKRHGGHILHNFAVSDNTTNLNLFGNGRKCVLYFCDSSYMNPANEFTFSLYKDNIFNETYDELCSFFYKEGSLCGDCENDTIDGLMEGDYKITITPIRSNCNSLYNDDEPQGGGGLGGGGGTGESEQEAAQAISIISTQVSSPIVDSANCCRKKNNCTGEPLIFTFTIKKFNHAKPLGDDRILCQDSTVILSIPESYTTDGNSAVWGTAFCGLNSELSPENLHQRKVINGGGGYHTVTISTTEGCLIKDTVIVADLKPVTINYQLPTALATNAVKYASGWPSQFSTIQWQDKEQLEYFADANIYYTGNAGIFRPVKSYDYADSLNSSANLIRSDASDKPVTELKDIYIRNTGNIIDYKLFNYGNPLFSDCVPQWVFNNQMTKYSPSGYDIENKDILDIHSSALYGYRDKLPIAVYSNAKVDEIGYESFEEYTNDTYDNITQLTNSTGNIDVVKETESLMMPKLKQYEIVRAFNRYAMIKGNICSACDEPFVAKVDAQSLPYDVTTTKIEDRNKVSYQTKVMASPCGDSSYTILRLDEGLPTDEMAFKCSFWSGTVSAVTKKYVPHLGPFNVELDDDIAHTGVYSLKLPADERILIPQVDMELIPKKKYHIGAWVHHADMYTLSPENLKYLNQADSVGILIILPNNEKAFAFPTGEVINGWQRVEGTFTMPSGMRTEIQLGFVGKRVFNIDDIRIFPQNSAIQTYVYDPQNYKVRSVLDQNNYATIYQYDDEGNLFTIKKETVKGIKTIQVSNSHIKSSKP